MSCNPSPFPVAALREATAIAPNRSVVYPAGAPGVTDGICAGPNEGIGDHYPDFRGVPHAFDVAQDAVHFNAHWYGDRLAELWLAGNSTIRMLLKYFVSHDYVSGMAKIFDPNVGRPYWRTQSGDSHISHLHTSFNYSPQAENYVGKFFGLVNNIYVPVVSEEMDMIMAPNKPDVNGRVPYALLDRVGKKILLFNGAAIAHDQAVGGHRELHIVTNSVIGGMTPTRNSGTRKEDGLGVEVGTLDGPTFKYYWS